MEGVSRNELKSYLFEEHCYREVHIDGLPFYQHKVGDPCDPDLEELFSWDSFPCDGSQLLELGCGDGFVTSFLAKQGLSVTGIDCSPTAIEHARQNMKAAGLEAELYVGDACGLEFLSNGVFPFILDSHSYHCITDYQDRAAFLQECGRLLSPAGVLFLATMAEQPMDWTKSMENLPWHRKYDVDEKGCYFETLVPPGSSDRVKSRLFIRESILREELSSAGFSIVRYESFSPRNDPKDFSFLVAAKKD
jgi:ubiquinone/menaquinone biosynthesis C-methylase UbiE